MSGFEPRISGVRSDRSTNGATKEKDDEEVIRHLKNRNHWNLLMFAFDRSAESGKPVQ